ncbi:YdbL family protein [Thiolapillus sp.]
MLKNLSWPVLSLLLGACVTINIYFPAAAAEQAAREIVRDVLDVDQPKEQNKAPEKARDDQSAIEQPGMAVRIAGHLVEMLVPEVHAGQADINIDTPAISRLRQSMQKRQRSLAPFYRSGAIGFDESGRVAIRDLKAVALKDRNRVKKLVADENRDRDALYREIARANGHPEWEADIRKTFSRIWVEEAPRGYWYRKDGSWKKK